MVRLKAVLDCDKVRLPIRIDGAGRKTGGGFFSRGHLYKVLSNPIYIGRLGHKGQVYEGQHSAIVDPQTWDRTQAQLAENAPPRTGRARSTAALLAGKLYDDRGFHMSASEAAKGSKRWRYYVSQAIQQGRKQDAGSVSRVSAPQLEGAVFDALTVAIPAERRSSQQAIRAGIEKVVVGKRSLSIRWRDEENPDAPAKDLSLPWSPAPTRRQREILQGDGHRASDLRPMRTEARRAFASAYGKARDWLDRLASDPATSTPDIAAHEQRTERSIRQTLSLAFLDPALVAAAFEGRLPRGFGLKRLMDLPPAWPEQWNVFGLAAPARR